MTRIKSRYALPAVLFFLTASAGCGGSNASVSGSVTLDGQSVDGGSISFVPVGTKESGMGARIIGGKYTVPSSERLPPGKYTVQITWQKGTGKKLKNENDAGTEMDETKEVIPSEYNISSKLSVELTSGSNSHNFDLKGGGAIAPGPETGPKKKGAPKGAGDS